MPTPRSAPNPHPAPADDEPTAPTLEERLGALEQQVSALVQALSGADGGPAPPEHNDATPSPPSPGAAASDALGGDPADPFWALHSLQERVPAPGAVVYAGSVDLPVGHVEYQWGRPTDPLLRADWAERAERVAALGHPLRLSILQRLLEGERTVSQLVDELDLASTGVAYHHLNLLQAAGWVASPHRGSWTVPPTRIVPLLAIITALEES